MADRIAKPPEDVIVGMVRGEWPVQLFTVDAHAIHWASSLESGQTKYLWRARLTDLVPIEVHAPEATLREAT